MSCLFFLFVLRDGEKSLLSRNDGLFGHRGQVLGLDGNRNGVHHDGNGLDRDGIHLNFAGVALWLGLFFGRL